MFTAEEKAQLDQLRWKYEVKLEAHIKPVEGGYLIQVIERFVDPAGIVVATASTQSIATNGLSVANMIYDLYGAEYDKDPAPEKALKVVGEEPASVPEQERYEPEEGGQVG